MKEMEKLTVVIIKSSPWKSAHLFKNHPEYSAIFNLIQRYENRIRFVLIGTSTTRTRAVQLKPNLLAWDIQKAGKTGPLGFHLELTRVLFKYRPHLIIVLGLSMLPSIAFFALFSPRSKYAPIFIGEFTYYGRKVVGRIIGILNSMASSILLPLSERKILEMFALSRFVRDHVVAKLTPNFEGKIRLISYHISPVFTSRKKASGKVSETPVILTVAGIEPRKGLDVLVKAVSLIPRQVKVIIKGPLRDGFYAEKLTHMVDDLRLKDRVTFVTKTINYDALVSYYDSATLFAFPTREDCLGVVILEALHCHLPIVATAVGGIPDMIEDGKNGILVKPNDPEELANAISLLLNDANMRQRLAENATRVLSERYYKDRITLEEALNQSVEHLLGTQGFIS
jgi:glycosyltransferase involved in cell wall biosynthesis